MRNVHFDVFIPGHLDNKTATEIVLQAESIGYDCVWTEDHLLDVLGECWVRLAFWAAITHRIHLGPLVSCSFYRSPLLLAGMSSTVNSLSKGRLKLGLGAGYWKEEFEALSTRFLPYRDRLRAFEEFIIITKGLLQGKEHFRHRGEFYSISNRKFMFSSTHELCPPILIGGTSQPILQIVAKHADGCNFVDATYSDVRNLLSELNKQCKMAAVSYQRIEKSCLWPWVFVSRKNDHFATRARKRVLQRSIQKHEPRWNWGFSLSGCGESCVDQIRMFLDIGITRFIIGFAPDHEQVDPFSSNWSSTKNMELFWDHVVRNVV